MKQRRYNLRFGCKTSPEEDNEVGIVDPCHHIRRIGSFTETVRHTLYEEVHRFVSDGSCYYVEMIQRQIL